MKQLQKERGWILRILDRMYPEGLESDMLKKQLIDLSFTTGEMDMRANIAYLKDKELVKVKEVGCGDIKRTIITLTATGKDVVDGTIEPVVGVDV